MNDYFEYVELYTVEYLCEFWPHIGQWNRLRTTSRLDLVQAIADRILDDYPSAIVRIRDHSHFKIEEPK